MILVTTFLNKQTFNRKIIFTFLVFCYLVSFFASSTNVATFPSAAITTKPVINVVTENYPPYSFLNNKGKLEGCSVELVKELFKINKDDLNVKIMPWSRAYMTALNTKNTLIFSIARNEIRESKFHWIGKIKQEKYFFWGLTSIYSQKIMSEDEFKSSLIVVAKYTTNDQMLTVKGENKLYRVTELTQGINMLLSKRVNLIVETKIGMQKRFEKEGYDFSKIMPAYELPELNYDLYIAMNLNSDHRIVKRMRNAYQQLVNSDVFTNVISQCGLTI